MLTRLVAAYSEYDKLRLEAQKQRNGDKGLKFGLQANVMDAAVLIKVLWHLNIRLYFDLNFDILGIL